MSSFPFAFWRLGPSLDVGTGFGINYGYEFDGVDESINFGNNLDIDGSLPFSFSFWVKNISNSGNAFLMSKMGGTNFVQPGWGFFLSGTQVMNFFLVGTGGHISVRTVSLSSIGGEDWKHIVVTYDGSGTAAGFTWYINNQTDTNFVNNDTFTGSASNTEDFVIGEYNSNYVSGRIDDIQFYNFELNSTQVNDIYNDGYVTAPTASPIHHWKMGESDTWDGSNWTVVDEIGSLNGTSVNMEETDRKLGVAYSFVFDGVDEYINFGGTSPLELDFSQPFTIAYWIKGSTSFRYHFGNDEWWVYSSGANCYLRVEGGTLTVKAGSRGISTTEWRCFIMTYDGNTSLGDGVKWYMSNNLILTMEDRTGTSIVVGSAPITNTGSDFTMGKWNTNYSDIEMMYFSKFDGVLTNQEIQDYYNNNVPVDPRNIGLSPTFFAPLGGPNDTWDGTNWTVVDEINGNNGTSVNMEEADKTSDTP